MNHAARFLVVALAIAGCPGYAGSPAFADGKVSLYVTRMEPADVDAKRFSRTSWGGGIDAVMPWHAAYDLVALTGGIEVSNMLSHATQIYDPVIRETLEQRTNQSYGRFFLGGRVGPHGPGVPQQLGEGTVSISPSYLQAYLAIGVGFDFIGRKNAARTP